MKKIAKSILLLLGTILFSVSTSVSAQELLKPELKFTEACNDAIKINFDVVFPYSAHFDANNNFSVWLSDATGDFTNEVNLLANINTENSSPTFSFMRSIKLPPGTFGTAYRIRFKSDTPAPDGLESPPSDPFPAYYGIVRNSEFGITDLEGNEKGTLCGNTPLEVKLTIETNGEYSWYRVNPNGGNGIFIATTQEPTLTLADPGTYYVEIDYGICGFSTSKFFILKGLGDNNSQIDESSSIVEICAGDSHTFNAKVNEPTYEYKWFKDNELISGATSFSYETPTSGQFGIYRLEIKAGTCETVSDDVELKQKEKPDFTITAVGAGKSIFLPCENRELEIKDFPSGATIQWYKDDVPLPARNQPKMNATEAGVYFAVVTDPSTTSVCEASLDSDKFELIDVAEFVVELRQDTAYEACVSSNATLSEIGIGVKGVDGNDYQLSDEQINADPPLLRYQWYKDSVMISGATSNELSVDSYTDNGTYRLEVNTCSSSAEGFSEIDVKLIALPDISSTSPSNALCGTITYTIDTLLSGYTYEWFKDNDPTPVATDVQDFEVDEVGIYVLKVTGFGCVVDMDPIEVVLFDESVVTVTPSEKVVLTLGQTVTVTADGADSYVWREGERNPSGNELSRNETLNVNSLGFYTLYATVGTCTIEKVIEVVEQDDLVLVPNVVTPNGDGKNDTWKISNRYAFQPSVTIIIYNSEGKELINSTDYKNDWPIEDVNNQRVFYYKIIRDDKTLKAGTISVLH